MIKQNKPFIYVLLALFWLPLQASNIDETFTKICDNQPHFSGMYLEKGRLVLLVNDSTPLTYDSVLFESLGISEKMFNKAIVKKVKYSFLDLHKAYKVLLANLDTIANVKMTDIDEKNNHITIAVSEGTDTDKTRLTLNELFAQASIKVPQDMLVIEIMPKAEGNVAVEINPPKNLFSSPVIKAGGYEIEFDAGDLGRGFCTWGFTARFQGELGFVTNSHCTNELTAAEVLNGDTEYSQSDFNDSPIMATSFQDAQPVFEEPVDTAFGNLVFRLDADAHFAKFKEGFFAPPIGFIARPVDNQRSLEIDTVRPYFRIVEKRSGMLVGTEIHKVGRTTGWTTGEIKRTCSNTNSTVGSTVFLPCQFEGSYAATTGDSGAAVFVRVPDSEDEIILHGLHHSSIDGLNSRPIFRRLFYSPINLVERALGGPLEVVADPSVPTPRLDIANLPGVIQDESINILNKDIKSFNLNVEEPGRYQVLLQSSSEFDSRFFKISLGGKKHFMAIDSGETAIFHTDFLESGHHELTIQPYSHGFYLRHIQAVPVASEFFLFPEEPIIESLFLVNESEPFNLPGDFFVTDPVELQPMQAFQLDVNVIETGRYTSILNFSVTEPNSIVMVCVGYRCNFQILQPGDSVDFEQNIGLLRKGNNHLSITSFSSGVNFFLGEIFQRK